ncbi:MAG TPA: GerMN domain-containing protein [Coleofasciculaceae cyanobacterium]|jgi:spore germination protein GerM
MPSKQNPPQQKPFTSLIGKMPATIGLIMITFLSLPACNLKPGQDSHFGHSGGPRDVVTVFFSKAQGSQSIVDDVARKVPNEAQAEPVQYALTELLKGPTAEEKTQGFYSEIPKGTKLLGVKAYDHTLAVNLSKQFATGGGSTSMQQRVEEIKQTVYSVDSNHQLTLAVEGQPLETVGGEGLEVPGTLEREAH